MSVHLPERRERHKCNPPPTRLFTDELPGYTPPTPDDLEEAPWLAHGRSIAIDHPRYPDGTLWRCDTCRHWFVYQLNEIPPGQYGGVVMCITTYRPRWRPVSWWDFGLRARIRELEAA